MQDEVRQLIQVQISLQEATSQRAEANPAALLRPVTASCAKPIQHSMLEVGQQDHCYFALDELGNARMAMQSKNLQFKANTDVQYA